MRTHIILTREQYSKAEVCTPDNLGEPTPWYEMVWTLLANCWTNHTKEIARTCQNEARWPCSNLPSKLNSVFKKWCNLVWSDEKETARNHATYCDWWLYNTVYLLELLPVLKRITQSCTRSSYCKSNSFAQRVIVETDWGASTWSVSRNLRIALPKITGASACWLEVLKCGRLGWHALADYKMGSLQHCFLCYWYLKLLGSTRHKTALAFFNGNARKVTTAELSQKLASNKKHIHRSVCSVLVTNQFSKSFTTPVVWVEWAGFFNSKDGRSPKNWLSNQQPRKHSERFTSNNTKNKVFKSSLQHCFLCYWYLKLLGSTRHKTALAFFNGNARKVTTAELSQKLASNKKHIHRSVCSVLVTNQFSKSFTTPPLDWAFPILCLVEPSRLAGSSKSPKYRWEGPENPADSKSKKKTEKHACMIGSHSQGKMRYLFRTRVVWVYAAMVDAVQGETIWSPCQYQKNPAC